MKPASLCFLLALIPSFATAFRGHFPTVYFTNLTPNEHTVFYGERKIIRIKMTFSYLKYNQEWHFPLGVGLQIDGGLCPPFSGGWLDLAQAGDCYFSLNILGDQLGRVITGFGMYHLSGQQRNLGAWNYFPDLNFAITVIPHPLSMANIPPQNATANLPFYLDLRNYVNYYLENIQASAWPYADVLPVDQDGLYYDPTRFAISGLPTRTGTYVFRIGVHNIYGKAEPINLTINVGTNYRDTPVFRKNYSIASAMPKQAYQLNLMELIESRTSFALDNQLHFRIDANEPYPDWLTIGKDNNNYLTGIVPASEAGAERDLTLIASSNTGGDSKPLKIRIPIATDPASKPSFQSGISLSSVAGG